MQTPRADLVLYRAVIAFAADWALIVMSFVGAIYFRSVPAYVVAAMLIARTQLALAVLMHEAAHGLLARDRRLNDFMGQCLAAAPLMVSLFAYRRGHLKHHRAPMAPDDPVAIVFQIDDYPITRRRLALRLLGDLVGIGYFWTIARLLFGAQRKLLVNQGMSPSHGWAVLLSLLLVHGSMIAALHWLGRLELYFLLWLLPAITLLQVMGRMRAIMEHAGYGAATDQATNARTIVRPSWQTFLFGPHAVHYHIEHHLDTRVPFYRLRAMHEELLAQNGLPRANLYQGYGAILWEVTRS